MSTAYNKDGEWFEPTMQLRWLIRYPKMFKSGGVYPGERLLQQAWEGDKGSVEWHTIDEVEDKDES